MVHQVGHPSNDTQGAESGLRCQLTTSKNHDAEGKPADLLPDVSVAAAQQLLNLVTQVTRHFLGGDVGESAERETDRVHVRVVHVATHEVSTSPRVVHRLRRPETGGLLLERVGHESQDLLVLVQEQHDPQVAQTLVAEARACHQLKAFDLSKVCWVAEHVNVQQFGDIVVPCERVFLLEGCLGS